MDSYTPLKKVSNPGVPTEYVVTIHIMEHENHSQDIPEYEDIPRINFLKACHIQPSSIFSSSYPRIIWLHSAVGHKICCPSLQHQIYQEEFFVNYMVLAPDTPP